MRLYELGHPAACSLHHLQLRAETNRRPGPPLPKRCSPPISRPIPLANAWADGLREAVPDLSTAGPFCDFTSKDAVESAEVPLRYFVPREFLSYLISPLPFPIPSWLCLSRVFLVIYNASNCWCPSWFGAVVSRLPAFRRDDSIVRGRHGSYATLPSLPSRETLAARVSRGLAGWTSGKGRDGKGE